MCLSCVPIFKWFCNEFRYPNRSLQVVHWWAITRLWMNRKWSSKVWMRKKTLLHSSHWIVSPSFVNPSAGCKISVWRSNNILNPNLASQTSHWYKVMFSWTKLTWSCKFWLEQKDLLQLLHLRPGFLTGGLFLIFALFSILCDLRMWRWYDVRSPNFVEQMSHW